MSAVEVKGASRGPSVSHNGDVVMALRPEMRPRCSSSRMAASTPGASPKSSAFKTIRMRPPWVAEAVPLIYYPAADEDTAQSDDRARGGSRARRAVRAVGQEHR